MTLSDHFPSMHHNEESAQEMNEATDKPREFIDDTDSFIKNLAYGDPSIRIVTDDGAEITADQVEALPIKEGETDCFNDKIALELR